MAFCIQDPTFDKSAYLHEALISACVGGISGGGAYAFASRDGIKLLMEDENFTEFLKNGTFTLVVGMDDITNNFSIDMLKRMQDKYGDHLKIKAYIHNSKGSTFHPKYSWFKKSDGGVLVIGSGNLTQKGLRQNREAYAIENLNQEEMDDVIKQWDEWIDHSKLFLFDLDEEIVIDYANKNTKRMKDIIGIQKGAGKTTEAERILKYIELFSKQPGTTKPTISDTSESDGEAEKDNVLYGEDLDLDMPYWTVYLNSEVLMVEIPRSGDRWQQVNFDKNSFENFFGATCGENGIYRILLRSMSHKGILGEVEVRPSVSVSSRNYRFELDAAKGQDYPDDPFRPVGVFIKVSARDFIYELVMPGDEAYNACVEVMDNSEPRTNRMRRIRYRCKDIYQKTSKLALWKRLDVEEDE